MSGSNEACVIVLVAFFLAVAFIYFARWIVKLDEKRKKKPLKFPVRIRTDDGYILISPRYECCDIEIKRVHEKGKTYYPNVQFRMGLSDVHFIHGTGKNKKTWTEIIHVPTGYISLKFITVLQRMQSRGRTLKDFRREIGIDDEGIL